MKRANRTVGLITGCIVGAGSMLLAADWPQWRGPNRDAHVADFKPPQAWPKELNAKWTTAVGQGVSSPALVGDRVYVFARQGSQEVLSCLDAATGKPVWEDKYEATVNVTGFAGSFPGPRSSPAVADGKVVTLDEGATVSCVDANSGKLGWRKDFSKEFQRSFPQFFTSFSPLILNGMAIVHIGGQGQGSVMALDLNNGEPKWKWDGEGPAYASPVVATIGGTRQIVTETERSVLGLNPADGKLLWQVAFGGGGPGGGRGGPGGPGFRRGGPGGARPGNPGAVPGAQVAQDDQRRGQRGGPGGGRGGGMRGGGRGYNAATPIVQGDRVIVSAPGAGTKAFQIEKSGDGFAAKELWTNAEVATQFNTPVLKDGRLYGLSNQGNLFCLDAATGKTLWTNDEQVGQRGFGSVVAAGPVMIALTPASELIVFEPSPTSYEQIARVKVANTPTHAYPVIAGNRLIIKDRDSVMMYELGG